ncbi:MAG TPA: flagellar hook-associated protein FlgK [Verrucomicrobiae bacterium]
MIGLFSTLDMAKRAMQAQMTAVEVAGQNIANVNTAGYTRQRAVLTFAPDVNTAIGPQGTGVNATSIQQVVNNLLDSQIQSNTSQLSYQQSRQSALQSLQDAFGDTVTSSGSASTSGSTATTGLSQQINDFFSAIQSLAVTPNSVSARQSVIGAAQSLASTFNNVSSQFATVKTGLNDTLGKDVDSANQYLAQIASLNSQITIAQAAGGNANDLVDQRRQAVNNLAGLTDIATATDSQGQISVAVNGQTLVSGGSQTDSLATYDAGNGQMLLKTATGGVNLTISQGAMAGVISARDNELGTAQNQLDNLAATIGGAVNNVQAAFYDSTGNLGQAFFTGSTAATLAVNPNLVSNPGLIAISAGSNGDNIGGNQLAQLATTVQASLGNQTISGYYASTLSGVGQALNDANTQVGNQQAVASMLSTQRGSVSGVNLDEEMTNMLMFQRSYAASAELLKTVDQLLQTTIQIKS